MELIEKIKFYSNEKFEILPYKKTPRGFRYAVTNYGRVISFTDKVGEGKILKGSHLRGYPCISLLIKGEKTTLLIHRLVATHFLRQPSKEYEFVIHLNNGKTDNYYNNLKWVNQEQLKKHEHANKREKETGNYKLTETKVRMIKKNLLSGKTRLKMIAKRFGVSDMQIHRIKTGENWGHVKVE